MAYMHGNLAFKEKKEEKVRYKETREVVSQRIPLPAGEKLLYLFTILLCVAVAGTILWKYTQIYEVNTKMQQIEHEIKQLEKENSQLKVEARRLQEPKLLIEKGKMFGFIPSEEDTIEQVSPDSRYYASRSKSDVALNR